MAIFPSLRAPFLDNTQTVKSELAAVSFFFLSSVPEYLPAVGSRIPLS